MALIINWLLATVVLLTVTASFALLPTGTSPKSSELGVKVTWKGKTVTGILRCRS